MRSARRANSQAELARLARRPQRTALGNLPGGKQSGALALNNAGQVVGWATTASGEQHAVLWTLKHG